MPRLLRRHQFNLANMTKMKTLYKVAEVLAELACNPCVNTGYIKDACSEFIKSSQGNQFAFIAAYEKQKNIMTECIENLEGNLTALLEQ